MRPIKPSPQVAAAGDSRYICLARPAGRPTETAGMNNFIQYLIPVALGAVAIVLLLGLVNMMRGGSGNRSQQLMRLRVLLQFAAIVIMMTALYLTAR